MNVPATRPPRPPRAPMARHAATTPSQAPSPDANTRVVQYTQRAKYIAGRAFFQNGNQWIDNNVSAQNAAKACAIKFGSDEYFALLAQHPEARPWLALGENVKLLLASTVYEIYDEHKLNSPQFAGAMPRSGRTMSRWRPNNPATRITRQTL